MDVYRLIKVERYVGQKASWRWRCFMLAWLVWALQSMLRFLQLGCKYVALQDHRNERQNDTPWRVACRWFWLQIFVAVIWCCVLKRGWCTLAHSLENEQFNNWAKKGWRRDSGMPAWRVLGYLCFQCVLNSLIGKKKLVPNLFRTGA